MWPYWLLFFVPALTALSAPGDIRVIQQPGGRSRAQVGLWVACLTLTVMIGYRYEVGADWDNYIPYLYEVDGRPLLEVIQMSDPGYQIMNWISAELGMGIYGVNLMAATVFSLGLFAFCGSLPRPWLALAIAVPYLVIVVGMGYTRQGIALGMAMLGLVALRRRSILKFVICVIIGATFHKTAVLLLPIAALAASRRRLLTVMWVAIVTSAAYFALLEEAVDSLYVNYVEAEYQSDGAMVRLLMNSLAAFALLFWWKKFATAGVAPIWRWFAFISLVLQLILFISPSSTAVDRVALYLLPMQLVVFSYWPDVMSRGRKARGLILLVLMYYALVQFVWLTFANFSYAWLPYRFYPLTLL